MDDCHLLCRTRRTPTTAFNAPKFIKKQVYHTKKLRKITIICILRTGTLEVPQRATRPACQLKTPGSESNSVPQPASRTPKDRSPKVVERRSPRSPASEKKRPGRVTELETQLAHLQEELKKAKDQLNSSESFKRRAQQDAEEAKKQVAAMSAQLEESQQQLQELSASEEARLLELRKISQDRDRAWESELEAVQKHHSMDSAALSSAMNEIHKLKIQLERASESARDEIRSLQLELTENLTLVEDLKTQLSDCKESESRVLETVSDTRMQLETAEKTEETLRLEVLKAMEAYKSLETELEASKSRINSLEGFVSKLQADQGSNNTIPDETEESNLLKTELMNMKFEMGQLKSTLEAAERRYQEEYIQSTLQIRSAYELAERTKSESLHRENELEEKLKMARAYVEELKAELMDKAAKLHNISSQKDGLNIKVEENQSELEIELKKSEADLEEMKATLLDKETELQSITEENEKLRLEITKRETERSNVNDEAAILAEAARASEREALMKVGYLTEETDKSSRKAARITEQLDAAQVANSEMEAELRRLKVQSDQWRKAAEAAASMLSTGGNNNGKFMERTGSLDSGYHTIGGKLSSPLSEDMDDTSPKKKNGNMLKKIGVLLKKGQK
ncbi:hypothetical protein LguiB_015722 [Lonicera macranthoides]